MRRVVHEGDTNAQSRTWWMCFDIIHLKVAHQFWWLLIGTVTVQLIFNFFFLVAPRIRLYFDARKWSIWILWETPKLLCRILAIFGMRQLETLIRKHYFIVSLMRTPEESWMNIERKQAIWNNGLQSFSSKHVVEMGATSTSWDGWIGDFCTVHIFLSVELFSFE